MTPTWVQKLLTEFGKITPSHLEDNKVADQLKTVIFFLKINFMSQSNFMFIAKLNRKYRDFLYTPHPPKYTASFIIHTPQYCGTFVTINELTLTNDYHSESIVYIRIHSLCCTFYGLGQIYGYLSKGAELFLELLL